MSIFSTKNKTHYANVIKNTGDGDLLVWRQPEEDFNNGSTLIVSPGEKAIFIKSGKIEESFGEGSHILSTNNFPFISKLKNLKTGGVSPFNCVVYFVKTSLSKEIKWGTNPKFQIEDKVFIENEKLSLTTNIGAHGAYKVCIENPDLFIKKLVGSKTPSMQPDDLNNYFFNEFQGKIKSILAKKLSSKAEGLRGIVAHLDDLANNIKPALQEVLNEYGLKCISFSISSIDIEENPLLKKIEETKLKIYEERKQADINAEITIKQGKAEVEVQRLKDQAEIDRKRQEKLNDIQLGHKQAMMEKEIMEDLGEKWQKLLLAGLLKTLANNPTSGTAVGAGLTAKIGSDTNDAIINILNKLISSESSASNDINTSSICFEDRENPQETLKKMKELLDNQYITEDDYNQIKKELLAKFIKER